jgi:hypothetical protein
VAVTLVFGCSSNTTGGATTDGNTSQGGAVSAGGSIATGGSLATGGASVSGGTPTSGGTVSTGGQATTGGSPPVLGGTSASGGIPSSGGTTSAGGKASSGGTITSGGAIVSGGTIPSGGASLSGGSPGSGGVAGQPGTGGATGAKGGTSAGGQPGSGGTSSATGGGTSTGPGYPYVFSCFNDSAPSSDLIIYTSDDALNFTLLYDTKYVGPSGYLRDPSIMKHTDGKFYVAFTTPPDAGCCGPQTSFAIASSPNLKDWTTVTQVPCGVAGTKNTWAPEWFKDTDGTIHVLVTLDGKTHRYEPTDATLTKWSGPTWIGIGPGVIDTFVVKVGTAYHSFSKGTFVQHGTAASLDGPWTFDSTSYWPGCKEAPAVIDLGNGTWRLFCDAGGGGHEKSSDSKDVFKTWTTAQTLPVVGNNISHGTVIKGN